MTPSLQELYNQGRHREIIAAAARSPVAPASDPHNSLIVAASLLQLGHLPQCQQICEALGSVMANNPQFLSLYATCLRRQGELQKAEAIFQHALQHNPNLPYLANNYANLLIDKGELAKAHQILERIVAAHPDYSDAAANLQRLKALPAAPTSLPALPAGDNSVAADQAPGAAAPALLDPLDLAFSEEEVEVEQRERRKRRQEAAKQRKPETKPPTWAGIPELPPVPAKEFEDELTKAGVEALMEKQAEAALILADLLNSVGPEARRKALKIASDAYLMLKCYPQAEITLLSLTQSGAKLDVDYILNLAALALKRHDLEQASHFLSQARKLDAKNERLQTLSDQLESREQAKPQLTFHPYQRKDKTTAVKD